VSGGTIVIGSGPNGLAAAIRLARAGHQVTVLEAGDRPGGAVRTEELTLPGFRHDTFSAVYPAAVASPVFEALPLAEHGLEWIHPPVCMAHPLPDGRAAALHADVSATARSLDALHPGDGARWTQLTEPYLGAIGAVRNLMLAGFPPLRGAAQLLTTAGPGATAGFARMLGGSAAAMARRLFTSDISRAWLYGSAMHGDAPPTAPGSAVAGFYLNLLGHAFGWPSPRAGAQRLTDALAAYLTSLGAQIRTGARVERIVSSGNRVAGVGVAGGTQLPAALVIADVMPDALLMLAGDGLAGWYRRALRRFRYGPATVKLDWALDGPIPWAAGEARRAGTVHVGGGEADILASIADAEHGLPARPFLLVGQQSVADPERAPAGRHTAWAYTRGPRSSAVALAGDRHVDAIEEQMERFAPGFRDRILARSILGPTELQARNPNLVQGDVGGGSYRMPQAIFRPLPSVCPYRTPVRGLYLGSAATFPGGAAHGVCGDAAARVALRDLNHG
jgi:phytoene dehydrogenase-like protein